MWAQESLFCYRSPSHPNFTFYYMPLPRFQQKQYRRGYHKFDNTKEFMEQLLRKRLVVMEERTGSMVYRYAWPEDEDVQDHLLKRLPRDLVVEAGAVVMGWMRATDEGADVFMNRIVCDLKEALA